MVVPLLVSAICLSLLFGGHAATTTVDTAFRGTPAVDPKLASVAPPAPAGRKGVGRDNADSHGKAAVRRSGQPPAVGPGEDPATVLPPASAGTNGSTAPPPPGSAQSKQEIAHALDALSAQGTSPTATLVDGIAFAPAGAPAAVQGAIAAANTISTTPYIWGGGHGSWYAAGYDCSGAVSFALHGAGLLGRPLTSGQLESYGEPGPGRWITIYANATHAYAEIAGLRWDTVGDARGSGPRWHPEPPYPSGFVVRHPVGY